MNTEKIQAELDAKKTRLGLYLSREAKMLTDGVQSYGIGTRNVARFNTDLSTVRSAIKQLETEVSELEGKLYGKRPRKAVGIIPRDL